jgi:hypothetical protein
VDPFEQGPVQTLCNAVELQRVMGGEFPRRSCLCQMLIECLAQVLPSTIGSQDLYGLAMVLCDSPCLKHLVDFKGLVFGA